MERIPRRILGSQSNTGSSTPVSTPTSLLQPLSDALEGLDPLTQFAIQEIDPLSQIAAEMVKHIITVVFKANRCIILVNE